MAELASQRFDLVIVGGGVTGACLALDAALRGLAVAVVDRSDFGGGASATSSSLLHGGMRYLRRLRLGRARETALERAYFQNAAPHLTKYVPFLIPTYRGPTRGKLALRAAALAHRALGLGRDGRIREPSKRVPSPYSLSLDDVQRVLPWGAPEDLTGAVVVYGCQAEHTERLTLAMVETAARWGAVACNYVEATSLLVEKARVVGVAARDTLTDDAFEIRADAVINATGPWIPFLNRSVSPESAQGPSGYGRGVYIVIPSLVQRFALALPAPGRGEAAGGASRQLLVVPWHGFSLVGAPFAAGEPGPDVSAEPTVAHEREVQVLIDEINAMAGLPLVQADDVRHAFAGVHPLRTDRAGGRAQPWTRRYPLIDHEIEDAMPGLYSVPGAGYTMARRAAERAIDYITSKSDRRTAPCSTLMAVLHGGNVGAPDDYARALHRRFRDVIPVETAAYLTSRYGTDAAKIADRVRRDPVLGERLCADRDTIVAEIDHAAENEAVCHLDDFVFRRTGLGTLGHPGDDCLLKVALRLGSRLGWDGARVRSEIERVDSAYSKSPGAGRTASSPALALSVPVPAPDSPADREPVEHPFSATLRSVGWHTKPVDQARLATPAVPGTPGEDQAAPSPGSAGSRPGRHGRDRPELEVPTTVLHIAPTSFFSDVRAHIRIYGIVSALNRRGMQNVVCTYDDGRDMPGVIAYRIPSILGYAKTEPDERSGRRYLASLLLLARVCQVVLRERPSVLYAYFRKGAIIGWIAKQLFFWRRIPLVLDVQSGFARPPSDPDPVAQPWEERILRRAEQVISRLPDRVICSADDVRMRLQRDFGIEAGRIAVVQDGVAAADMSANGTAVNRRTLGIPEDRAVVAYSGSLLSKDGADALAEVIAATAEEGLAVHFLVIGYPIEELEAFIASRELDGRVSLVGRVPFEGLRHYLACADAAIEPKPGAAGTASPNVLAYMSAGLPVVCADDSGNRSLLGDAGYYADEGDAAAAVAQIRSILSEPEQARERGLAGARRVRRDRSWDDAAARISEIYEAALQRR